MEGGRGAGLWPIRRRNREGGGTEIGPYFQFTFILGSVFVPWPFGRDYVGGTLNQDIFFNKEQIFTLSRNFAVPFIVLSFMLLSD